MDEETKNLLRGIRLRLTLATMALLFIAFAMGDVVRAANEYLHH